MKVIPELTDDEKVSISIVEILSKSRGFMAIKNDNPSIEKYNKLVKKGVIILIQDREEYRYYKPNT